MKFIVALLFLFTMSTTCSLACTVCKTNQPKILQGITHGVGPETNWDYLIVIVMIAVVAGTFLLSLRYLIRPGESTGNHIKHSILNPEIYE